MQAIEFVKFSGSGNDFICLDGRDGRFDAIIDSCQAGRLAQGLCRRGLAVGADGMIIAQKVRGAAADVAARFFEPDGGEANLCGNGAACVAHWALHRRWAKGREVKVLTSAGVVRGRRMEAGYVRVCIPLPEGLQRDIQLGLDGRTWTCDYLVTGVPHAVAYVDDLEATDVPRLGPMIRWHERFAPKGANANFVQVIAPGRIALRTFEAGVENETLACGTGAAAAAVLTALRFGWPKQYLAGDEPVLVRSRGGDVLRVHFNLHDDGAFEDVCLDTVVRLIYVGTVSPGLVEEALGGEAPAPAGRRA